MKYMGNKTKIVNDILPIMLENYNGKTFVDAFCGSCAIIQDVPPNYIRIDFYDKVRNCFNGKNDNYEDDLVGWVGYMASFNGRFFDAGYSGHNVIGKTGKARDYIKENINNIKNQIEKHNFKNINWFSTDYYNIPFPEQSLIYCDIPYKDTKQYKYSKSFDYEMFYDWCKAMKEDGHTIFISEYQMPSDFKCIWQKEVTNAMNPTITKKPIEKLFTL